jgi:hypothetical protein
VLDCTDGGRADAAGAGGAGGTTGSGPLCIQNPSLEGTPQVTPFSPFAAAPWNACPSGLNAGTVVNETASSATPYPVASDGNTYGTIGTNSGFGGLSILSQELCEPIAAGEARSFQVDLARMVYGSGVEAKIAQVQLFGDSSVCGSRELLWTSPDLTTTFSTFCVTLRPEALTSVITFSPLGDQNPLFNGLMTALVDHIVPVAACP